MTIWPRLFRILAPPFLMTGMMVTMKGADQWLGSFATTQASKLVLLGLGLAAPSIAAALSGLVILFSSAGSRMIKMTGAGVAIGALATLVILALRHTAYLALALSAGLRPTIASSLEPAVLTGAVANFVLAGFALRVAIIGNAAFAQPRPRRITGKRALYGDARWMRPGEAKVLFPSAGGMVIGEAYRVDADDVQSEPFRPDVKASWGAGGRSPLLCFDAAFGSGHGLVFAGSGGFKTTSVTIPTALKWGGSLVLLDPSKEVGPMVASHRLAQARRVRQLDPGTAHIGFNVLDWIGKHASTKEEDIAAVAGWIMSEGGSSRGARDDFFRASALQLLTAMIADVCLSGHTPQDHQTLRQVRTNLSETEPKLKARLQEIHTHTQSDFVRENVAAFVNMTPETFSGVYANAIRETHWLSYQNYASLVSGSTFTTDELADGHCDVFINLDLKTLEAHAGLARVIIGSLMNAIYNRNGQVKGRTLFLIDEAARLGFMRILETARDAGRKYGITLMMLYQSIGQLRETYGGRDASSKWFESASWISFAAINDPETADYVSKRCGLTTVEIDQVSRSTQMRGGSSTRSKQLAARPLIQPHEVLRMRGDEQIVFTAGNPPLRCGRAIWFRRDDMRSCVAPNQFDGVRNDDGAD